MAQPYGRRITMSLPRRFMSDLTHFGRKTPLCTAQRIMQSECSRPPVYRPNRGPVGAPS